MKSRIHFIAAVAEKYVMKLFLMLYKQQIC